MMISFLLTLLLVKETVAVPQYYCGNILAKEAGGASGYVAMSIQDDGTGSVNMKVDLNKLNSGDAQMCDFSKGTATCIYIYIYIHIHTYIHIYIHTYIHIY
jgi:hypothetical protein